MISRQGHTDIFGSHSIWPSQLRHKLLCIKPHFDDIVEEGEHRCQRKGGHKEGDKAKLDDYGREEREELLQEKQDLGQPGLAATAPCLF